FKPQIRLRRICGLNRVQYAGRSTQHAVDSRQVRDY
ncbi:MAG: hypothetical protein ACJA0V_002941, partial [Planctomycetota bacterium]